MIRYVITPDVALPLAGLSTSPLTRLQADALVTLDQRLAEAARTEVAVGSLGDLTRARVSPAARGGDPPRHPA